MAESINSSKDSLLKKFDIPIEHLSYEYVEKCELKNKKELERIVRILRSGEEGLFPDLIKFAEAKLQTLCPNSRVLRTETPVLTKESFEKEEWKKFEEEMCHWENDMKVIDQSLEVEKQKKQICNNLPQIRKVTPQLKPTEQKSKVELNKQNERIKSNDYKSWDKFDVDKELLKMDVDEERKIEENKKKKREIEKKMLVEKENETKIPAVINGAGDYTHPEKKVLADQAKDRGNECFKTADYENAIKYYTISINFSPTAAAYNNRAMTYLKQKQYVNVIKDCNEVLKLEPNNVKALHRRGTAYQSYTDDNYQKLALRDFEKILTLEPNNRANQKIITDLKHKLNLDTTDRRFRMNIHESGAYSTNLPLTFYGPSTSRFACLPNTMEHRVLSGSIVPGHLLCKCNSPARRQNPLCQKCGEKLSRPPPYKRKPLQPVDNLFTSIDVKRTNERINEQLKENINESNVSNYETKSFKNVYNGNIDTGTGVFIKELTEEECKELEKKESGGEQVEAEVQQTEQLDEVMNEQTPTTELKQVQENFDNMILEQPVELSQPVKLANNTKTNNNLENKRNRKKRKKKNKQEESTSESMVERCKIIQASKYIKPTLAESKKEPTTGCGGGNSNNVTTAFQFIKMWEACSKCDENCQERAEILCSIKPDELGKVIGNKLDGQMLSSILECLDKNFNDSGIAVEYMNELSKLPRFGIISMFLEQGDKAAIRRIFEKAEQNDVKVNNELKKSFLYS